MRIQLSTQRCLRHSLTYITACIYLPTKNGSSGLLALFPSTAPACRSSRTRRLHVLLFKSWSKWSRPKSIHQLSESIDARYRLIVSWTFNNNRDIPVVLSAKQILTIRSLDERIYKIGAVHRAD
jgi:hypothetical protein